jgi:hypothetical protein
MVFNISSQFHPDMPGGACLKKPTPYSEHDDEEGTPLPPYSRYKPPDSTSGQCPCSKATSSIEVVQSV